MKSLGITDLFENQKKYCKKSMLSEIFLTLPFFQFVVNHYGQKTNIATMKIIIQDAIMMEELVVAQMLIKSFGTP